MLRVRLAAVSLLAGLLPLTAGALGLGEITLRSALNQPLVAEIPVTADSAEELNQLTVQLAPASSFERFGLDRPRFLDDLDFQVKRDGSRAVVRVTSTRPVSEPFISLLLDVGWAQGRLLREYTVLLDPPTFARPDSTGQGGARAPVPVPAAPGPEASAPAIQRVPLPAVPPAVPRAATGSVTSGADGDTYGPVRSNETLWRISERLRADRSVSLNQMMVALYRANPEAFAGNINRLRRGAILRVPRANDVSGIASRDATAEVRRQDQEWRGAVSPSPAPARLQLVPPAEKAAVPAAVGAGSTPGPVAPTDRSALQRDLAETRRLMTVKDGELKLLQDRVRQLEAGMAAPAPTPAPTAVPAPAEMPAETPTQTPTQTPPEVALETPPELATDDQGRSAAEQNAVKRSAREASKGGGFLSSLTGLVFNVWFLVSAAVVLLAGLFLVFARRRMASADEASGRIDNDFRGERMATASASSTQPVVVRDDYRVEEQAGDRTQSAPSLGRARAPRDTDAETALERTISTEAAVELDQADVVAEADFHMAYGLYDQAAELLTRALAASPDRRDLRLKLLEVFFIWENKAAFLKEAKTFQRQLKGAADPDWNKVVIMGKQICPGEPLFAGTAATTGDARVDLALADGGPGGASPSLKTAVDFDLTASRKGPSSDLLDFDLGSLDEGPGDATGMMQTAIARRGDGDAGGRTAEVPTVEARYAGDYSPTVETPTIQSPTVEMAAGRTLESPTLENRFPGLRSGVDEPRRSGGADPTEEINLEDLGLDLTGLDEAAGDLGTGVHGAADGGAPGSEGGTAASGIFDLGMTDDAASDLLEKLEGDPTAESRRPSIDEGDLDLPAFGNALEMSGRRRGLARDAASDTAEHKAIEDTAEQPRLSTASSGDASGERGPVDFDISGGTGEDLEPTSVMTGRRRGPEGPTMTEVGTKLDLARAYVDMGDPDGARSILNEVLEEGDSAQRQEARRLLDDLAD